MNPSIPLASFSVLALMLAPAAPPPGDFVVGAGQIVVYDTANGPILAPNVFIEAGGTLRVVGTQSFHMRASRLVQIDGTIDLSGFDSHGVVTIATANLPEPGANGEAGGGNGGTGNPIFTTYCPAGGNALDAQGQPARGGRGGESGYSPGFDATFRRPGGGGGGALGPDQPVNPNPDDPTNLGRIARPGRNGALMAFGALTAQHPPAGGAPGTTPFTDGNPNNDFFGHEFDPVTQTIIVGELTQPLAGRGGGGGGNAMQATMFPPQLPFTSSSEQVGAGAGGGGGLGVIIAVKIAIGAGGRIRCNGGHGGGGENTNGFDRIGGGSGGGSGGMVIVEARIVDLSHASANCITALGGRGGAGANDFFDAISAGGNGGPGIIQIHVPHGAASIQLPPGMTLDQLTAPAAHVLLPEPGL